jgi:hypothetical protein
MAEENGARRTYLLFAWSPTGYELYEREGEPPEIGAELVDDGNRLEVVKVGASPLPGDARRCVYTVGTH